jgi:hypothetical protein
MEALGARAPVALELLLDPIHGRTIAIGAREPIPEFRERFDRGLVAFEIQPRH